MRSSKNSSNGPLALQNLLAGIMVTVIGGVILAYVIQDARFAPRLEKTGLSTPSSASIPTVSSPEQTVRHYYSPLNNQDYEHAWQMLSDDFKENFIECSRYSSYQSCDEYMNWWSNVRFIEIEELRTVDQTESTATVYVQLSYLMKDNSRIPDEKPYIQLVLNAATHSWLFSNKGLSP